MNRERVAFVAVCLLAACVVWIPARPPMVDLPQHAAQIAMLLRWGDATFHDQDLFELNLFTPYLFAYGLTWLLAHVVSVLDAIRLVTALGAAGFPLAFAGLRREVGGDPRWDWLVIPLAYGFAWWWGLLSFTVGAPLALVALLYVLRYQRDPSLERGAWLAVVCAALFFVHVLLTVWVCAIGVAWCLVYATSWRDAAQRSAPLTAPLPVIAAWSWVTAQTSAYASDPTRFTPDPLRSLEVIALSLAPELDRWASLTALVMFALPFLAGARPAADRRRWVPAAVSLVLFLLLPDFAMGNHFTVLRFAMFGLPVLLVALDPPHQVTELGGAARAGMIAVPVAWMGVVAVQLWQWDRESRTFDTIEARMAPERRVLALMLDRTSDAVDVPAYMHLVTWYAVDRGGVVDFSYASLYPQVVRYRASALPSMTPNGWGPADFDWRADRGWTYDYIVVRGPDDAADRLLGAHPVHRVAREGVWSLYERD